ncbi:piggyBac transposable element-derived protein 4-like [Schistocerca serialis cubense]|uniref:piggyBac transposable element-derived protein 4-like n=1 Tax=Schistocerca serialis cubense TaxID=2023355 RepID=UPI00214F1F92|nr:piggyBac transposable element-derived protein 4-like [Schistocerca serialis cubense]XP_049946640.1 piggyBac transposable element-derived protein 4-like [Schistocerca serialis cubense]XP_049955245.1 piggyBac transposable element-derived protein 4-like [Schistocerca serialis cubense]
MHSPPGLTDRVFLKVSNFCRSPRPVFLKVSRICRFTMEGPKYVSNRSKRIVALARSQNYLEESDSEVDSDESCIPDEDLTIQDPRNETDNDDDSPNDDDRDDETIREIFEVENTAVREETGEQPQSDITSGGSRLITPQKPADVASSSTRSDDTLDESRLPVSYYGRNKCFTWSSTPVRSKTRTAASNIIKVRLSKIQGPALTVGKNPLPGEVWRLLFTDDMIETIVKHTNEKLAKIRSVIELKESVAYRDTTVQEVNAVIGVTVLCSIFKSAREPMTSLFSTSVLGRPIFRSIITEKRLGILLRAFRFDDSSTREQREKYDPAAAITDIFNKFIWNCQQIYSPGAHLTVDETLVPFRGRVKFRIYMPNKPAKYGIKVMGLADAHNAYIYNAYIYSGKGCDGATLSTAEKKKSIPTQSVIRLSKGLYGTNRNISCDNWFCSVELAQELLAHNLTLVGTLKRNRPQIPAEFQARSDREIGSSLYGFTKEMTLLSYVPKRNKAVLLLSSMHHSNYTDVSNDKPEIISFYNATKSGIDTLDMKCSVYSTNRKTRRWPLAIFYHMVAMAGSNASILYGLFGEKKTVSRFDFLKRVSLYLVYDFVKSRLAISNLPQELQSIISSLEEEAAKEKQIVSQRNKFVVRVDECPTDTLGKRKTCRFCPYQKKRKTAYKCISCEEPTCLECSRKVCKTCAIKNKIFPSNKLEFTGILTNIMVQKPIIMFNYTLKRERSNVEVRKSHKNREKYTLNVLAV